MLGLADAVAFGARTPVKYLQVGWESGLFKMQSYEERGRWPNGGRRGS